MSLEGAACRGKPLVWFFPEHGQTSKQGKEVCQTCPCRAECLSEALSYPQEADHGVRGGLTQRERDKLRETQGMDRCQDCGGRFVAERGPGPRATRCMDCRRLWKNVRNAQSRERRKFRDRTSELLDRLRTEIAS